MDETNELLRLIDEVAKALSSQYGPHAAVDLRSRYPETKIRMMSPAERDRTVAYINGYLIMLSQGVELAEQVIGGLRKDDQVV